jgi:hypothetical protein
MPSRKCLCVHPPAEYYPWQYLSCEFPSGHPCFGILITNLQENICIADDGTVRVTDIATDTLMRQTISESSQGIPSNWMYKCGEELWSGDYTMQADVYSFAATIYFVRSASRLS